MRLDSDSQLFRQALARTKLMLAAGMSVPSIAKCAGLSPDTVHRLLRADAPVQSHTVRAILLCVPERSGRDLVSREWLDERILILVLKGFSLSTISKRSGVKLDTLNIGTSGRRITVNTFNKFMDATRPMLTEAPGGSYSSEPTRKRYLDAYRQKWVLSETAELCSGDNMADSDNRAAQVGL